MTKTVLILNNPSSISILFTALRERVDELWIERSKNGRLDSKIGHALKELRIDRELPLRHIETPDLFVAGRQRRGKVRRYRQIAALVDGICSDAGVTEVICSTTSAFRLAQVPSLHVVDHGTGDYLRTSIQTHVERLKYAWLYSGPRQRAFHYYAFLPLPGRIHLPLQSDLIRDHLYGVANPFDPNRVSVILLVHPRVSVQYQLRLLHDVIGNKNYDLYLKGHHFDMQDLSSVDLKDGDLPPPRVLPKQLDVLPAEFLFLGFDEPLRLAAVESTALWNVGAGAPGRIIALSGRDEIIALHKLYASGLEQLEKSLNYYPFK